MVKPIKQLQMGKNGLTPTFINQIKSVLTNEKVMKITILKSACRDKAEAKEIAEKIVIELGQKYNYKIMGYTLTIIKFRKEQR